MKIVHGYLDSGADTAGRRAFKDGLDYRGAVKRWRYRKNSLWVKDALRAFQEAGGWVPPKPRNQPEEVKKAKSERDVLEEKLAERLRFRERMGTYKLIEKEIRDLKDQLGLE